jgi:4-hydroxy-2-oxoheptanedioate aldolase
MQEPLNLLKAAVLSGNRSVGVWCSLASALTTEIVAGSGADWVLIDGEHSPNDLRSMMASDDPTLMKQALDIGARSLMIPNVRSAEQARTIVAAMTYAPAGFRGFSVGHRANAFGRIAGYHASARKQQLLAVQIEDELGVKNAREIAAVDGVDVLFVGPGDLSTNMGSMGNPAATNVQQAITAVREAARAAGKASGILAPVRADAERYLADGFTMVAVGSDLGLLARGSDALVASFRS